MFTVSSECTDSPASWRTTIFYGQRLESHSILPYSTSYRSHSFLNLELTSFHTSHLIELPSAMGVVLAAFDSKSQTSLLWLIEKKTFERLCRVDSIESEMMEDSQGEFPENIPYGVVMPTTQQGLCFLTQGSTMVSY